MTTLQGFRPNLAILSFGRSPVPSCLIEMPGYHSYLHSWCGCADGCTGLTCLPFSPYEVFEGLLSYPVLSLSSVGKQEVYFHLQMRKILKSRKEARIFFRIFFVPISSDIFSWKDFSSNTLHSFCMRSSV